MQGPKHISTYLVLASGKVYSRATCNIYEITPEFIKLPVSHPFWKMTIFECLNLDALTRIEGEVSALLIHQFASIVFTRAGD
jgi:hypothetical protein